MNFGRAFTYVFEDNEWVSKLVITFVLVIASSIPVFGLIATSTLLGYISEIIHNVRNGHPRPLPKWVDYGDKMTKGAYILLALVIYNVPLIFMSLLLYGFSTSIGASLFGSLAYVVIVACLLPLMFLYTVITWTMLAIGLIRYSETGDHGAFYRFGIILRRIQYNVGLTAQWVFYSITANILLTILLMIPCVGWIAAPALYMPVQGYLIGQYGRLLAISERNFREGRA